MGKVRLECPNCGKAIAVSDTAKKARCPGCKEVIDLTPEGAAPEDVAAEQAPAEEAPEPMEEAPADEEAPPEGDAPVEEKKPRPSKRRPSRIISSAQMAASSARSQPLLVAAAVALVVCGALVFLLTWWPIAIVVACSIFVFVETTLSKVTRITPSSGGSSWNPMLWGLMGLGVVPVILYLVFRRKLIIASAEDLGDSSMSKDDLEDAGKVAPPSLLSPGAVLIVAVVAVLCVAFWKAPSVHLDFAKLRSIENPKPELGRFTHKRQTFDQGVPFAVRLRDSSKEPFLGVEKVVCTAFRRVGGNEEQATSKEIDVQAGSRLVFWTLQLDEPGNYRVVINTSDGSTVTSEDVRIRATR